MKTDEWFHITLTCCMCRQETFDCIVSAQTYQQALEMVRQMARKSKRQWMRDWHTDDMYCGQCWEELHD